MLRKLLITTIALSLVGTAQARDTVTRIALQDAINMGMESGQLDGSVRFFLEGQHTPSIAERHGEGVSNKKTNGVGKDDVYGCRYVALSALISLQQAARQQGANAVVDIVSYYKKNVVSDPAEVECHAGAIMIGVALRGEYATLAD
ncbi:MAG: excinuclease ATPase subunit [Xanthomonadales bacterium]|nr:excinuclease ATPase subunit [Xanthomonadales bacterium]